MGTRKKAAGDASDGLRYRPIVAKLGTNLLTPDGEKLDLAMMSSLVGEVAIPHQEGIHVILVTSGAIATRRQQLGAVNPRSSSPGSGRPASPPA
jgi:glutamate 5-kinase